MTPATDPALAQTRDQISRIVSGVPPLSSTTNGNSISIRQTPRMSDAASRVEVTALLGASEARMDARVAEIRGDIKGLITRMDERDKRNDELHSGHRQEFTDLRDDMRSVKNTVIITGISTALTIVLGVAAFNATVLSNMVASFESGKGTATAITQATEQMKQTQDQLKALQETLQEKAASR